jgi:DNA-binding response OmpR family regulator
MQNNNKISIQDNQSSFKVLLVEDDQLTASLLKYIFIRHGFQIQLAHDGDEAQTIIQSADEPPDLIMLDLTLPFVDGYELLQLIRSTPDFALIPVLILSGKSQEEDIVRAFKLGASDFMAKPFNPNELIARIARFKNEGKFK